MDSILFWNAAALEANRISHSDPDKREQNGPTLSSRALAIVHLAMYDAYAGVINDSTNFPRYFSAPGLPAPGASVKDAVAGAAFTTLAALFKTQCDFFEAQLACFNPSDPSFAFGEAVGNAILKDRENDPGAGDCGYMASLERGKHRPDPDNPGQGFHAPFYGANSKLFAATTRHDLDDPPLDNPEYLRAFRQVRARGIMTELLATLPANLFTDARKRNALQTTIGIYWAYDGANRLGTPPRQYNQIIRILAASKNNSEGDNARLFAFVNAAMGDAGILAWEQKYFHDFWRPVVGIREHDKSFGPMAKNTDANNKIDADADPFWLPLGAPSTNSMMKNVTPNFPAYPSGHATFGAAAFHITRLFYGIPANNKSADNLFNNLSFVSDELNGGNRNNRGTVRPRHVRDFPDGLWGMILENARSRIYLGVHWIFDAFKARKNASDPNDFATEEPVFTATGMRIGGVPLGLTIAEDIFGVNGKAPAKSTQGPQSGSLHNRPKYDPNCQEVEEVYPPITQTFPNAP